MRPADIIRRRAMRIRARLSGFHRELDRFWERHRLNSFQHLMRLRDCVRFDWQVRRARLPQTGVLLSRWLAHTTGHVALPIALWAGGIPATIGLAFCLYFVASVPFIQPDLEYAMDRWAAVELVDADGCHLGVIPGGRDVGIDEFSYGHVTFADHKVITVDTAPQGYWDTLVALENRGIGTWRTLPFVGADWVSVIGSARDSLTGNLRGASGLPQLIASSLVIGDHGVSTERLARKVAEFRYGTALYTTYWEGGDPGRFRALAANYLPLVRSTSGSRGGEVIHGVGTAARVLWGIEASDLELWQQAVLAAAVKDQVLLAAESDAAGQQAAEAVWDRVRARAETGLRIAYGEDDPRVVAALDQLRRARLPQPRMCDRLEAVAPEDPVRRFQLRFNLAARAQHFAGEVLSQVVPDLRNDAGEHFNEHTSRVDLTLSGADNTRVRTAVREALYGTDASPVNADILFAVADRQGRIRYFHQPNQRPVLNRPQTTASIAKVLAAVSLAENGSPRDMYCNRRIDGELQNHEGFTGSANCRSGRHAETARDAFGNSHNLAIFDALTRQPVRELARLMSAAGFTAFTETPDVTAIAFGLGEMAPADMIEMFAAVGEAAEGRDAIAVQPGLITATSRRAGNGQTPDSEAIVSSLDLTGWLETERARRFVRETLSAPLATGATATRLRRCGLFDLAKSGTWAEDGRTMARLLVARDRTGLTYFVSVSSLQPSEAAPPIYHRQLADALCAAAAEHGNPVRNIAAARPRPRSG